MNEYQQAQQTDNHEHETSDNHDTDNTTEMTEPAETIPSIKDDPQLPDVQGQPSIDVGEMTKNPEAEVVDSKIEYGTKEGGTNVGYRKRIFKISYTSCSVHLAKQTNVNTRSRFICYDIHELGKQLMPIGMLVVLDSILNRITENRAKGRKTYIFIDEIYLLFQHEYSANFLFTMWKKVDE